MDRTNERSLSLQRNTAGLTTTLPQSSALELLRQAGAPEWEVLLYQMSQDKRHDLDPAILPYWRQKVSQFTEREIADALMHYRGEYFPSVDAVIGLIEVQRDSRKVQDYQPIDRNAVEAEQSKPEWDESAERARSALRKLAGRMA